MQPILTQLKVLDVVAFGPVSREKHFFAVRLTHPGWNEWHPGQFVMLRPESFGLELPWGRPFCICHMTARHLVCFIKTAGTGTERMAALRAGDKVMAWGPLGNYFAVEPNTPTLILAAGMGIAPFVGYVNRHPQPWNLAMLFGNRDPLDCYPVDSINEHIPVDSLREHEPGELDNLIYTVQEKIRDCAEQKGLVLACGPLPFLRVVRNFAITLKARAQISLENRMACGIGACLGCVCRTTSAWPVPSAREMPVQVCTNGPVFWADQVEI